MKRSEIVMGLATVASQGKYEVSPEGAAKMNAVFQNAAKLINELEAEEKAAEEGSNDE